MLQSALSPEFFCDVRPDRERVVVRVGGEFDVAVAADVAAIVDELLDAGFARIVVDLRDLTFMDSAAVHALVSAHRSAERRGCALSLVRGPGHVHRVLELTATDSLFDLDRAGVDG
jgi:anti-sigma B factor antagonist